MEFTAHHLNHQTGAFGQVLYIESTLPVGITIDEYRRTRTPGRRRRFFGNWFR